VQSLELRLALEQANVVVLGGHHEHHQQHVSSPAGTLVLTLVLALAPDPGQGLALVQDLDPRVFGSACQETNGAILLVLQVYPTPFQQDQRMHP